MAFTATELQEWVKGLGLPEDKAKVVLESFGAPEVLTKVGESVLARADYSRGMDKLKADETALRADLAKKIADEEAKTVAYSKEVGKWKQDKEAVLAEATKKREEAEARLTAVQGKLKEIAPTYGIPEDQISTLMTPIKITPAGDTPPRDVDSGKWVSKDEYNRALLDMPLVAAIISELQEEHRSLFGSTEPMPKWSEMVKQGKPLRQNWEERYKVPERRAAIAKDAHDKEIAEAEKRGAEAARSKWLAENPTSTVVRRDSDHGSPILSVVKRADDKSGRPDETRGIAAAVAAFNEGKYRDKTA
jgi:hypothetical protein